MDGYVTTGVTWIPRHIVTIFGPFFLDVGRMPAASKVSIQFHMVSYCSAIKFTFLRMEILFLFIPNFSQRQFSRETVNWLMADYNFKAISSLKFVNWQTLPSITNIWKTLIWHRLTMAGEGIVSWQTLVFSVTNLWQLKFMWPNQLQQLPQIKLTKNI